MSSVGLINSTRYGYVTSMFTSKCHGNGLRNEISREEDRIEAMAIKGERYAAWVLSLSVPHVNLTYPLEEWGGGGLLTPQNREVLPGLLLNWGDVPCHFLGPMLLSLEGSKFPPSYKIPSR